MESIPQRSRHFNWEIEPHVHDAFLQIFVLTKGQAHVSLNDRQQVIQAPYALAIPAQNVHGFQFSKNVDGVVITAAQRPLESVLRLLQTQASLLQQPLLVALSDQQGLSEMRCLIELLQTEWRMPAHGQLVAGLSLLLVLLTRIARQHQEQESHSNPERVPNHAELPLQSKAQHQTSVSRFKELVNKKFQQHLPLESYAKRLGVSAGHLTRLTKATLGQTALQVIQARIKLEAERQLIYTSDSIKQIAAHLGYDDEAYFSRFFRKVSGQTPKAFRQQAALQLNAAL